MCSSKRGKLYRHATGDSFCSLASSITPSTPTTFLLEFLYTWYPSSFLGGPFPTRHSTLSPLTRIRDTSELYLGILNSGNAFSECSNRGGRQHSEAQPTLVGVDGTLKV
jgi:hypothetical protein